MRRSAFPRPHGQHVTFGMSHACTLLISAQLTTVLIGEVNIMQLELTQLAF